MAASSLSDRKVGNAAIGVWAQAQVVAQVLLKARCPVESGHRSGMNSFRFSTTRNLQTILSAVGIFTNVSYQFEVWDALGYESVTG